MVIRLLIADDQALVRGALAALLGLENDIEVVAQVGRGDEVVEADSAGWWHPIAQGQTSITDEAMAQRDPRTFSIVENTYLGE